MKGQITQNIDVAQVVLYTFWAFFAYLIFWLRREDKREGYPLEFERPETAPYPARRYGSAPRFKARAAIAKAQSVPHARSAVRAVVAPTDKCRISPP